MGNCTVQYSVQCTRTVQYNLYILCNIYKSSYKFV